MVAGVGFVPGRGQKTKVVAWMVCPNSGLAKIDRIPTSFEKKKARGVQQLRCRTMFFVGEANAC